MAGCFSEFSLIVGYLIIMQANMTYGVCDLPEVSVSPASGEAVTNESSFICPNRRSVQLRWLVLAASVIILCL